MYSTVSLPQFLTPLVRFASGDAPDLPLLKLTKAGQLAQSLAFVYQKAGASPVPSVKDKSTIYVLLLAANLFEVSSSSTI